MARIKHPAVTRFMNEALRPICEESQIHAANCEMAVASFEDIAGIVGTNRDDTLEDDRADEGVTRLTVGDLLDAVATFQAFLDAYNGVAVTASSGRRETQRKPSVRLKARR